MVIKNNDKISVEYEGKLETGEVFDSSKHGDHAHPIEFIVGKGMVIKGFDEAVIGMEKGEEKEFILEPNQAYGEYNSELKRDIPRNVLPEDQKPEPGMVLGMQAPNGQQMTAKILEVSDDKITIDLNHPLAGKKLTFNIKILDINPPEKTEENQEPSKEETSNESKEENESEKSIEDLAEEK